MSDVCSLDDDDDIITGRGRPRKRPRSAVPAQRQESDADESSNDYAASLHDDQAPNDSNKRDDKENEKPKSRYRIHIPTKADCPSDTFSTQIAERSSSPYRIDDFQWRKPTKQAAVTANVYPEQASGHVVPVISASHPSTLNATVVEQCQPARPGADEDEFDSDGGYDQLLNDIPQDAWASQAQAQTTSVGINGARLPQSSGSLSIAAKLTAPLSNLKQTTLFGTQVESRSSSQSIRKRNWPVANRDEPATHHEIDREAMQTWIYPINLGAIRNYQYSIVASGLYSNLLVALPTGLGKTFIAATIMLNWFRWTKSAQLVFVAPTKPLVSQQVKACFEIAGIPRSTTTLLTGSTAPGLRAEEWRSKRVFFMTPQTLINDLKTGICDPKRLVLIVIDEAHRATGSYAYVEVINFVRRFNDSFRVLALTATPGASIESVQEVINGLGISRIEIRTEESIDIREYVHSRKIDTVHFDNSEEMTMTLDLFSKALQPAVDKLTSLNAYWSRDPLSLTPYGCTQARQKWFASDASRNIHFGVKATVMNTFSLLASLSHATELLKFHGLGPFYQKVLAFRNQIHAGGKKGDKYSNIINTSEPFQKMMSRLQIWINSSDFIGHPKLQYVQDVVMNHFLDAGEGRKAQDPSATRIMIFAHYRSSAEELVRVLKRNEPMIRPHVFVGQSSVKESEGMDQKTQLEIIQKFQKGIYNTLVATSIGEEGLDIGEVDLIICYDASASPIRMLQRMGRTGRKRAGNIIVTLMNGKESDNFSKAKDNYEKIQREISAGDRFEYHEETARRIVPREIQPAVDKKIVEIPYENTQAGLPEPTKRGRPPKRPPKKFHMPDHVRTGFVRASHLNEELDELNRVSIRQKHGRRIGRSPSPVQVPLPQEVLLNSQDQIQFERQYLDIAEGDSDIVKFPALDAAPRFQRMSRPFQSIRHSRISENLVHSFKAIHAFSSADSEAFQRRLQEDDKHEVERQALARAEFFDTSRRSLKALQTRSSNTSPEQNCNVSEDLQSPNISQLVSTCPSSLQTQSRASTLPSQGDDELPDIDAIMQDTSNTRQRKGKRRAPVPVVSDDSDDG